jgi:DNA-binding transcriptional LysR family regulator
MHLPPEWARAARDSQLRDGRVAAGRTKVTRRCVPTAVPQRRDVIRNEGIKAANEENVETRQLRTFAVIVETKSFTRAGRRLSLSQSAISQQIGTLERQLGVKLLRRTGTGASPTAAGELLLHYARQVLEKIDEAQRLLIDYEASGAGVLRVGAGGAACEHLLPAVLKELRERFPRVEVHVLSGPTPLTVQRLLEDDLDVGLVTLPVAEPKLRVHSLGRDELIVIVAPGHPWTAQRRIRPLDLAGQALVVYERRSQTYHVIERVFLEAGVFPSIAMEMDHLGAVSGMVRAGFGVAVVPAWAVKQEIAAGDLIGLPIGKSGVFRTWGLALREDTHRPQTQKTFVRLCAERIPELLSVSI